MSAYEVIIVKDTAQRGEFKYITSACTDESGESLSKLTPEFIFRNDSLIVEGLISANCGTFKTATLRNQGDTIAIKTWEVGERTSCSCLYFYEIGIPDVQADSVFVNFNGQLYMATATKASANLIYEPTLTIYPNPAKQSLQIKFKGSCKLKFKYDIADITGVPIQTGICNSEDIIILDRAKLKSGLYHLKLSNSLNQVFIRKVLIE